MLQKKMTANPGLSDNLISTCLFHLSQGALSVCSLNCSQIVTPGINFSFGVLLRTTDSVYGYTAVQFVSNQPTSQICLTIFVC